MKTLVTLLLCLVFTGCSAVKKISDAAVLVHDQAAAIKVETTGARLALGNNDIPAAESALDRIDEHADTIQKTSEVILTHVPDVQDKTPWWATIIKLGLIAGILGAVVFLLWRLNGFLLIEKIGQKIADFFGWIIGAI